MNSLALPKVSFVTVKQERRRVELEKVLFSQIAQLSLTTTLFTTLPGNVTFQNNGNAFSSPYWFREFCSSEEYFLFHIYHPIPFLMYFCCTIY